MHNIQAPNKPYYDIGMVEAEQFRSAVANLKPYGKEGTSVSWVNWRKDQCQIKVTWHNNASLACYLNFFSFSDRDHAHAKLFERHAKSGEKPFKEEGHGWTKLRYTFWTDNILTINELAQVVNEVGCQYTVIYAQECIESRPLFDEMGIPLVPGEMGKELIGGQMMPYSKEAGKNL